MEKAKRDIEAGYSQVKQWWVEKYKLPPNHELFENQSFGELTLEMFEDMLLRKQDIMHELENADGNDTGGLMRQLNLINKAIGEEELVQDDLIDKWEREIEAGIVPDLDER